MRTRKEGNKGKGREGNMHVPGCFPFHFIHLLQQPNPAMPVFPNRDMPNSPLDQLKRTLTDKGLYSPPEGDSPASHDDATLLSVPSHFISTPAVEI